MKNVRRIYITEKLNENNKCISYCLYMKNIINYNLIEKKKSIMWLEKANENMDIEKFL